MKWAVLYFRRLVRSRKFGTKPITVTEEELFRCLLKTLNRFSNTKVLECHGQIAQAWTPRGNCEIGDIFQIWYSAKRNLFRICLIQNKREEFLVPANGKGNFVAAGNSRQHLLMTTCKPIVPVKGRLWKVLSFLPLLTPDEALFFYGIFYKGKSGWNMFGVSPQLIQTYKPNTKYHRLEFVDQHTPSSFAITRARYIYLIYSDQLIEYLKGVFQGKVGMLIKKPHPEYNQILHLRNALVAIANNVDSDDDIGDIDLKDLRKALEKSGLSFVLIDGDKKHEFGK